MNGRSRDRDDRERDPVERAWIKPIENFRSGELLNNDPHGPGSGTEEPEHRAWRGDDSDHVKTSVGSHEARVAAGFERRGGGVRRQYEGPLQGKGDGTGMLKIFGEAPDISEGERRE